MSTIEIEERFTEDERIADAITTAQTGGRQPSFKELSAAMNKYGPDCILEAAIHLPESEYEALRAQTRDWRMNHRTKLWEKK